MKCDNLPSSHVVQVVLHKPANGRELFVSARETFWHSRYVEPVGREGGYQKGGQERRGRRKKKKKKKKKTGVVVEEGAGERMKKNRSSKNRREGERVFDEESK